MDKFAWGQKIQPSKVGKESGILEEKDWGICVGYNKRGYLQVVRNNHLTSENYSENFWEDITNE